MRDHLNKALTKLQKMIDSGEFNCHFNDPASIEDIESAERCLEISLPASYKEFLLTFDGGFICDDKLEEIIKRDHNTETAVWNSCNIFGFKEMMQEYIDLSDRDWKVYNWIGIYPIIPFARTQTNELLVFILPLNDGGESPVFDAFHEEHMSEWGIMASGFTDFLDNYIEAKGQLNCISKSETAHAPHELAKSGWKMSVDDLELPHDRIDKYTECLKFDPNDSWNLRKRAYAYMRIEDWNKALLDLDMSIDLYPEQSYAYCLRGDCYMQLGKYAHALRDFSIAIEREPDDIYYISCRAEAYHQLGDHKRAIEEATKVIEIDENYDLAYMTRCAAYTAIGETEKAEEDAAIVYYK